MTPRVCRCGCNETTRGGEFAQGHDMRYKSMLRREVAAGGNPEALEELERRGWSTSPPKQVLQAVGGANVVPAVSATEILHLMKRAYAGFKHLPKDQWPELRPEAHTRIAAGSTDEDDEEATNGRHRTVRAPLRKRAALTVEYRRYLEALIEEYSCPAPVNMWKCPVCRAHFLNKLQLEAKAILFEDGPEEAREWTYAMLQDVHAQHTPPGKS